MSKKRKVTVRVEEDEAFVVAPIAFWDRILEIFYERAEEFPSQEQGWKEAAEHVESWVVGTSSEHTMEG